MKKQLIYAAVFFTVCLGLSSSLFAQINAGISIGDRGLRSFYLSVGDYYNVPQREVVVVHERNIPDEEIPVVFYIAKRAHVSPEEVAVYRRRGCSWMEVTRHYGLGPDIYGRTVVVEGGPRGNAWGYYKHNKHRNVETVYVNDNDIVSYVNTRVVCDRYGCSQDDVHRLRNQGYGYVNIHDRYYNNRHGNDRIDRGSYYNQGNSEDHGGNYKEIKVKEHGNGHGHGHGRWDRD